MELNDRQSRLEAARQQAARHAATLEREHNSLEAIARKETGARPAAASGSDAAAMTRTREEDPADMVARLHNLSDQRKTLMELDRRIQDTQQLAETYKSWSGLVDTRRAACCTCCCAPWPRCSASCWGGAARDRPCGAVSTISRTAAACTRKVSWSCSASAVAGVVAVLFIVFGPPGQMPTIIGLATAGMTVVLRDFIVAFFGWFVLIGRTRRAGGRLGRDQGRRRRSDRNRRLQNGAAGDGELEHTGHPTGRRVSFMNGYAIEGVYFNFSTAGQWLWDELQVTVPAGGDPYRTAQRFARWWRRRPRPTRRWPSRNGSGSPNSTEPARSPPRPSVDLRPGARRRRGAGPIHHPRSAALRSKIPAVQGNC